MRYTINGIGLNLADGGSGDRTLLFLHYFGGSSRTWGPVADVLAPDFRCLAPDLRGWGESDAPPSGYAVADMADDLAGLIAALGLTQYTLIGHSLGGKVAQAFTARRPPGLQALLLLAPSPLSPEPMSDEDRAAMRASYGDEEALRKTLGRIASLPLAPETEALVVADNLRASRAAWEAWADGGSREDLSPLASKIAVPTFVLAGERDGSLGPDVLTRLVVERIAGATLATVPGAGHLLPLEAPEPVAAWVRGNSAK